MFSPKQIRNIAIIAHIDHGKTTLLDGMLKQSHVFRDNEAVPERAMDSYDQERERGITIFAKHTSIYFDDYKINIVDTPGHADFSGEVERVLGMVNSVLLLVDAQEGPMPQTRFVLSKALKMGHCPIVVVNKIDRPYADPHRALDLTFDLFAELGATDKQLDFSYCFASGLMGFATRHLEDPKNDMRPLFELVIEKVPVPEGSMEEPFLMQASTLSYDDYVGRQACGRILSGVVKKGQPVVRVDQDGNQTTAKIVRIEGYLGLKKVEMPEAGVGDIVSLSGMEEVMIGDTICAPQKVVSLPPIHLDKPTLSMDFAVNSSPFVGRDGTHVTMNKLRERLLREKKANVSLRIDMSEGGDDTITVAGRGELHLAVLIEAMRREGYEMAVSKPRVIVRETEHGKEEPIEQAHVEVPQEFSGTVIEELSRRKGEMQHLHTNAFGITQMEFLIPSRGLMGYRNDFLTVTKGLGILTTIFDSYAPWKGPIPGRERGVLVAASSGQATAYSIGGLQDRGQLFVSPGDEIYEGMIVGQNSRDNDLIVNVVRGRQLTNVRAAGKDETIVLTPARRFTLEQAIDFIEDDELVEVTPNHIRLRKRYLTEIDRKRAGRK